MKQIVRLICSRLFLVTLMIGGGGVTLPSFSVSKEPLSGPQKSAGQKATGQNSGGNLTKGIKPFKMAVLDIDRVIREATASQGIQELVDLRRGALQRDVETFEKELRQKEVTLKELQNKNDPTFEAAKKVFENEVTDVQRRISGRSKILEKVFTDARAAVLEKVMSLVSRMAEENGYTLVIPRNVVMYLEDGYEITDGVLARLNAELPAVEIKIPEGA